MRRAALLLTVLLAVLVGACRTASTPEPRIQLVEPSSSPAAAATAPLSTPSPVEITPVPEITPTPTPEPEPPVAAPVELRIPKIGIDAHIIPVGVNNVGEMESPRDAWSVAWYAYGFKPSERGNAVMAAHVDYVNVGPAVFWNLRQLVPGDQVEVVSADSVTYTFEVKRVERYDENSAPVSAIFGPNPNRGLNLITCDGVFNPVTHDYNQRMVVYTEALRPPTTRPLPSHHRTDDIA